MVQVCRDRQLLPGPQTHEAMGYLRDKVASGELSAKQSYQYYLDALGNMHACMQGGQQGGGGGGVTRTSEKMMMVEKAEG